jgi:CHAT domain-containing protein/Tfp pilus assembly protein PilF
MKAPFVAIVLLLTAGIASAQQSAGNETKVYVVGKDGLVIDGRRTKDDPPLHAAPIAQLKGAPHQVFHVKLHKGQRYVIELMSGDFDAFLILEDPAGKALAHDDDSGGGLNSRIGFAAQAEGAYRLLVVALDRKPGVFQLRIRLGELSAEEELARARALYDDAVRLYRAGRYREALPEFTEALDIRQRLYPTSQYADGHRDLALSLNDTGALLIVMGQPEKGMTFLERAWQMRRRLYPESAYPDGHRDLAASLTNLGNLELRMGRAEKALSYFEQALAMNRKLYSAAMHPLGHAQVAASLNNVGAAHVEMGQAEQALSHFEQGLQMGRRIYPKSEYPDGHQDISISLNNLGRALLATGEAEKAAPYFEQALDMRRRLYPQLRYPDGHPDLAASLLNQGAVLQQMGQAEQAVAYFEQAWQMHRRLYPVSKYSDGHPRLAISINNLGFVLDAIGQTEKAIPYLQQALEMRRRLYPEMTFADGHPEVAESLNNLAVALSRIGDAKARTYAAQALQMTRRLYAESKYPNGHPTLARRLANVGYVLHGIGESTEALAYAEQAWKMDAQLYPESKYSQGHPNFAKSLNNLGFMLAAADQPAQALIPLKQAWEMQHRFLQRELSTAPEAVALDLIAKHHFRRTVHLYCSAALEVRALSVESYQPVWDTKHFVQRLLAQRHSAATIERQQSDMLRRQYDRLGQVQKEIGRLLNNPGRDLAAHDKRLQALGMERDRLEREVARAVPAIGRAKELDGLTPGDLSACLPAHAALIDVFRYQHWHKGEPTGDRYLVFMLLPTGMAKASVVEASLRLNPIELGDARPIDQAIQDWRQSIEARERSLAGERLRQLVWTKIASKLPPQTTTLYIAPDGDMGRIPWSALPVGKDRVLLEDYTLSLVPHGRFLLEQLKYTRKYEGPESVLAVANLDYGAGGGWPALAGAAAELKSLEERAKEQTLVRFTTKDATAERVRAVLPQARFGHFATHGFFDSAALSAEKQREAAALTSRQWGDDPRVRIAAKNPLGYVGLVLSNGEIMSGLSIVDLPLENLKLITLSACETGLGDYTGGEGIQGLQRAFHLAGCPNVVTSLWKVNDAATAALMAKFYHEMWVNNKPPIVALREAQLTIYRHPELIPALAGERGRPQLDKAVRLADTPFADGKRADTKLWAAFVLSGLGR